MTRISLAALVVLAFSTGCVEIRRADDDAPREEARAEPASKRPAESSNSGSSKSGNKAAPAKQGSSYAPNEAGARVHALPARFRPLTRIVGKRAFPFQSETTITTIGEACYTPNLAKWLKKHPPGGPVFEAIMRHEQLHAKRQLTTGVDPWIDRYLKDKAFMWSEEQRGWYEQIRFLRGRGFRLDAKAIARNLDGYSNLRGGMVSYAEALEWAESVLKGSWRPH